MVTLTGDIEKATAEINRIAANPNASTASAAQSICRRLSNKFATFVEDVKRANGVYAEVLEHTEDSLEFLVSFQFESSESAPDETTEGFETLRSLQQTIAEARDSILGFADTIDGLPRMERRLNRETIRTSAEIRTMVNHLHRIYASISRALNASRDPE